MQAFERNFHMDCFDECIFSGKGLIDVTAYLSSAAASLSNDAILSHDIIESSILRPGLVQGCSIVEVFPQDYISLTERSHRWMRGDWHNAIWMIRVCLCKSLGGLHQTSPVSRLVVLRLVRRCLSKMAVSVCLLFVVTAQSDKQAIYLGTCLLAAYTPAAYDVALAGGVRRRVKVFMGSLRGLFLQIAFALHQGLIALDAMGLAVFRFLRGKNVLEWKTCADAQVAGRTSARSYLMLLGSAASAACVLVITVFAGQVSPWSAAILAAWTLSPFLVRTL
jgi:hypothetical protein